MSKNEFIKAISKKLREKWGYSKHQIDVYWIDKKDLTIKQLEEELKNI